MHVTVYSFLTKFLPKSQDQTLSYHMCMFLQ